MQLFFDDEAFDGQLQRSVGKSDSGMANVGECLHVASQITAGDPDSWHAAWSDFATRLVQQADEATAASHPVSARNAYLRAAEYHRQAFFFHREDLADPAMQTSYAASVAAFRAALPLLDHPGEASTFADSSGYVFTPEGDPAPRPTIVHIGGYDGTAEELYAAVPEAIARGYTFVAVDGPGQGASLYERGLVMRPDYEQVLPEVVDAIVDRPEVDPDRLVLVGRSFGGLLAVRGAAGEPRFAALVVDPGQYDIGITLRERLGDLLDRVDDPDAADQLESLLTIPPVRAIFAPRMATHGVTTVQAFCKEALRFTNAEHAPLVRCPTYVTDNETDLVSTGQGQLLFDHLTCPKELRVFTAAEGAEGHCEGMAPTVFWAAAYDWLDETLG